MPSNVPTVKEVAWLSLVSQISVMALLVIVATFTLPFRHAPLMGVGFYLVLAQGLRLSIASAHRRAIRLLRRGRMEEAIQAFHESYRFFSRHTWVDLFRSLTLLSSSAYSYREMALCNIAFLHAQLGRREEAISWYRRALEEFPGCSLARTSLALAEPVQS